LVWARFLVLEKTREYYLTYVIFNSKDLLFQVNPTSALGCFRGQANSNESISVEEKQFDAGNCVVPGKDQMGLKEFLRVKNQSAERLDKARAQAAKFAQAIPR